MTAIALSVVGHTNTGKTSLMRTLLRDSTFGEVQNSAATTRHVEQATLGDWLTLFDTPGLEDAGGVLDWLETHTSPQNDGIERLTQFLHSDAAKSDFSQESKVLRQLIDSDAALYVVDTREPVLPKYKDELTILSWCARPIMPVFNFVQEGDAAPWQTMLSRRNLHVFTAFDTVAFDFDGEIQLWQKLTTMLPENHRERINHGIQIRQQHWQNLENEAKFLIANFLLETAAYAMPYQDGEQNRIQDEMQHTVRQHERHLQTQLCQLFQFYHDEFSGSLNTVLQTFRRDPFDPDLLKSYGVRTSTGAAAGALIGLGLDALTLGTSLGLGATIGGLIGGVASNWQSVADKISGRQTLHINADTLTLLAARNLDLLHTLQTRGHASTAQIAIQYGIAPWKNLPEPLKIAQRNPKWSPLNGFQSFSLPEKIQAANTLTTLL